MQLGHALSEELVERAGERDRKHVVGYAFGTLVPRTVSMHSFGLFSGTAAHAQEQAG